MSAEHRFTPPCGPIIGRALGSVVRASGIPYARAPRFHPPRPVDDFSEPYRAFEPAPACPQWRIRELEAVVGSHTGGLPQSEDCQNLTVTMPESGREGELLPVMVWIHGGSYISGAGDAPIYDPTALVEEQRVVVVSVTYRLGAFGFLGGRGRSANLGLMDQLCALEWVQRNIAAFGGDPDTVTLFGQSAGGDAIAHLMATSDAPRLFRRAIMQSPPLGISRGRAKMTAAMAAAGPELPADASVKQVLRLQEAARAAAAPFGMPGLMPFGTQYGASPLPEESQVDEAWTAVAPRINIMITHTAEEARLFIPVAHPVKRLRELPVIGPPAMTVLSRLGTRLIYVTGIRTFLRRHRRAGGRGHYFIVDWAAPGNFFRSAHGIDVALLFGTRSNTAGLELLKGASWEELNQAGRSVRSLWAGFARGAELPAKGRIPGVTAS
ncbi:carboxylesterase family protein [Nesterenkonia sandarakina]|uniref:Carboxylic ester hydrolase n=1 Tax=Nesterenkonia sandarakina TaxID=272918 RepID=A0A2T0YQ16_9MICC|nr:carboxylesterase family protein [Nesterenkonia sandarakina]PRZ17458.1 para-nitrobenzyl esterase [Nesterenkonia sandarakina]